MNNTTITATATASSQQPDTIQSAPAIIFEPDGGGRCALTICEAQRYITETTVHEKDIQVVVKAMSDKLNDVDTVTALMDAALKDFKRAAQGMKTTRLTAFMALTRYAALWGYAQAFDDTMNVQRLTVELIKSGKD